MGEQQQPEIEIDSASQARDVRDITGNGYFQQLRAQARDLRRLSGGGGVPPDLSGTAVLRPLATHASEWEQAPRLATPPEAAIPVSKPMSGLVMNERVDRASERESMARLWEPNSRVNTGVHYALTGEDPRLRKGRRFREMLPGHDRCKNCRAPFDGPASWAMRLRGRGRYNRNPQFCNF